jgi:acyl-CoA thioesterase
LTAHPDPQALAQAVAAHMIARDPATRLLGMELLAIAPGHARLSMKVTANMLNSQGVCHGGMLFALADSAFAYSCNSRNQATVASACNIDFLRPVQEGDQIIATASERSLGGRTGVYDIVLTNQREETVALFRGKSYRLKAHVV